MISAACHKRPLLPSMSGVRLLGLYRQPKQFCETSAEVTNYVGLITFCETMWKPGVTEHLCYMLVGKGCDHTDIKSLSQFV